MVLLDSAVCSWASRCTSICTKYTSIIYLLLVYSVSVHFNTIQYNIFTIGGGLLSSALGTRLDQAHCVVCHVFLSFDTSLTSLSCWRCVIVVRACLLIAHLCSSLVWSPRWSAGIQSIRHGRTRRAFWLRYDVL